MKDNALLRLTRNDYAFTIFTKVVAVLIGLVTTSLFSRYLHPALMGEYAYINTLLTTVAVIANFGLYQPYPFYKRQEEPEVLSKFLNIFSLQFVVYAAIGTLLSIIFHSFALMAVCLIAPVQVLANQLSFMIMVEDVRHKNIVFLTARIVNAAVIALAFITLSPSLLVALALIVIGDLITIIMVFRKFGRVGNPFRADLSFLYKILGFGFVAMITTLMLTLNYRVDIMMLEWMHISSEQIGFYQAGIGLAEYGWIISDAFREVLFSRTAKKNAVADVTFSLRVNLYITLLIVAGIIVFGKPAIYILRGARYLPSYNVTVILLTGVVSMSYFKLIGTLLLAEGKKVPYLIMLTASVLVNIVANWITIPLLGTTGAALSSVLSYTVAGAAFLVYFVRTYQVRFASLFLFEKGEIRGLVNRIRPKKENGR